MRGCGEERGQGRGARGASSVSGLAAGGGSRSRARTHAPVTIMPLFPKGTLRSGREESLLGAIAAPRRGARVHWRGAFAR